MEETAALPSSAQFGAFFKPLLEECGYTGARLQPKYRLGDLEIPLVGFASSERDMDSACIVAIDGGSDPEAEVRKCYELAAPVVWVRHNGSVDWWKQRPGNKPELFDTTPVDQFRALVRRHQSKLDPISIYQGRTLARINPAKQLDFVDAGLLPLMRKAAGKKLHDIVESMIDATLKAMRRPNPSTAAIRDIFTSVFRMLAGKILADKGIGDFRSLDQRKPKDVLEAVAKHYDTTNTKPASPESGYTALKDAAALLADAGSFAVVSPESLAYVYEHTLVTKELRKKLGIHATPPWLVDYMVWQLYDWVREIPIEDRRVFEPACGHAPFLLSMMRLLRMEMDGKAPSAVHAYLKDHIHGAEIDDFAREIARLSLTLADIPNPNGWDLKDGNMFASDVLIREATRCRILLSNPPYEKFKPAEKKQCEDAGYGVNHKKAVELVTRTIDKLPAGAVFGLVVPQTIISGPEAKYIREFLLRQCELAEVCRFPGKVFKFAQIETAIILGRRNSPGISSAHNRVRLRTVGERGMAAFQHNYAVDEDATATQERLLAHPAFELKLPALDEVWETLKGNPRVRDVALVGRGIEYKGKAARNGKPVVSESKRAGFSPGFAGVSRNHQAVYSEPPSCWLATDAILIGNPRQGRATRMPQVLLNMGRTSRFRWRIKPMLDASGRDVKNNFAIIRPTRLGDYALYLWAVLNSPIASAFVASRTMRKHNYEGIIGDIPLPPERSNMAEVVAAAIEYRQLAGIRDAEAAKEATAASSHSPLFDNGVEAVQVTPEVAVREALLRLDAAILRAYALPVRIERQLLDYFNGNVRAGVGCTFGDYYPPGFKSLVPLHKFISSAYRGSTVDQVAARFKPSETSAGTAALRAAAEAFGDDSADRYARASALLDKWASEKGDFDDRVYPRIERALRDSAPRHFPES